jgi:hypothetical protein
MIGTARKMTSAQRNGGEPRAVKSAAIRANEAATEERIAPDMDGAG